MYWKLFISTEFFEAEHHDDWQCKSDTLAATLLKNGSVWPAFLHSDWQLLYSQTKTHFSHIYLTVWFRAVPEIILGEPHFFLDPSTPRTHMGSEPPRPPGHVSALINPPHYGSNIPWPPGQVTPHPLPLGHTVNKTPSPYRTKKCLHPPG